MQRKIAIMGDSHTRSFAHISNTIPVFLSSGSTINLDDKFYLGVSEKIKKVYSEISEIESDVVFFLYLGEPNVRYQLNNDWYVHWDKKFIYDGSINKKYLDKCLDNYRKIIDSLDFYPYVITPTTAFNPSLPSLKYFNLNLKRQFGERVVDIYTDTIDRETGTVKESLRDPNFERDPIHLNSSISRIFFKRVVESGIINDTEPFVISKEFCSLDPEIKGSFSISQFGTYCLK